MGCSSSKDMNVVAPAEQHTCCAECGKPAGSDDRLPCGHVYHDDCMWGLLMTNDEGMFEMAEKLNNWVMSGEGVCPVRCPKCNKPAIGDAKRAELKVAAEAAAL